MTDGIREKLHSRGLEGHDLETMIDTLLAVIAVDFEFYVDAEIVAWLGHDACRLGYALRAIAQEASDES